MPLSQQHLPIGGQEFAADVGPQCGVVAMVDLRGRRGGQAVTFLCQPEGKLLVFIEQEDRVEPTVGDEQLAAVGGAVSVDEIDGLNANRRS